MVFGFCQSTPLGWESYFYNATKLSQGQFVTGAFSRDYAEESRQELIKTVTEMASRGLRTLCLAYADVSADKAGPLDKLEGPPQLPLTACCMLGIKVSSSANVRCCESRFAVRSASRCLFEWMFFAAFTAACQMLGIKVSLQVWMLFVALGRKSLRMLSSKSQGQDACLAQLDVQTLNTFQACVSRLL